MDKSNYRSPSVAWDKIIPLIAVFAVFLGFLPLFSFSKEGDYTLARLSPEEIMAKIDGKLVLLQGIALNPVTDPIKANNGIMGQLRVVVTAYSSTPQETDNDPFITASGSYVKDGIIANNYLPFGTLVRIPEIYGEKIFIVKDRMNRRKGNYHIDIWLPSNWEAKNFGVKRTYIEILEG